MAFLANRIGGLVRGRPDLAAKMPGGIVPVLRTLNFDVVSVTNEVAWAARAREHLALYRKNEDLVSIGAYQKGGNSALDQAIALHEPLAKFSRQAVHEHTARAQSYLNLKQIVAP